MFGGLGKSLVLVGEDENGVVVSFGGCPAERLEWLYGLEHPGARVVMCTGVHIFSGGPSRWSARIRLRTGNRA